MRSGESEEFYLYLIPEKTYLTKANWQAQIYLETTRKERIIPAQNNIHLTLYSPDCHLETIWKETFY